MGSENTEQGMKVIDYFKEFFTSVKTKYISIINTIYYCFIILFLFRKKIKKKS